jgi:hypothetical protein
MLQAFSKTYEPYVGLLSESELDLQSAVPTLLLPQH